MSKKLHVSDRMKAEALTRLKLYWKEPRNGKEHQTWVSLDTRTDKRTGNYEPGIRRLVNNIMRPNIGQFRVALIYLNQPNQDTPLRKYNEYGILIPSDISSR